MVNWAYCLKCNHILKLRVNRYQHRCCNCWSDKLYIFPDFEIRKLIDIFLRDNGHEDFFIKNETSKGLVEMKQQNKKGSDRQKEKEKPEEFEGIVKPECLGIQFLHYDKCNYCQHHEVCRIERDRLRGG